MAFLDHNGESEFPLPKDKVFDAMCLAIPTIKGMKIEIADKLQGRILVKAGVSLWSWGENIPIQLTELSENKTKVQITSSPKTGILFGGAFDMGKNRKNIELILSNTSRLLSNSQTQTNSTETNQFQTIQNSNLMEQNNNTSVDNYVVEEFNLFKKIREAIYKEEITTLELPLIHEDYESDKTAEIKELFIKMKYYANAR